MAIVLLMLITTIAFIKSPSWGVKMIHNEPIYAAKLFDTNQVHTIDIIADDSDWDNMLANAMAEEYIQASVVINGESVKGVGIRPKGNSSLSSIANSDSDRYSFKIEFDHYEKGKNFFGLDKLALNNIAQDNTYMKDYVTYQMMNAMGADAPLSSFIWVTVNGEDWGLYLAVEAVEESFAKRVYGSDFGEIYKPDTMDMGNMQRNNGGNQEVPRQGNQGANGGQMPNFGTGEMPNFENGEIPNFENGEMPQNGNIPQGGQRPNMGGFGGFGGGGATSLLYTDDNPESYAAIFDNAAFNPSQADKKRLIASLKQLNEGEMIEDVVDIDEVIRYFVVHNFVLNSDSYTGSLTHNYYLAEKDGKLSMIAWDYNLAFGGMGGMGRLAANTTATEQAGVDNATSMVNYPIDSPMLAGSITDKPMIAWIFEDDQYINLYHERFAEFMEYFDSGQFAAMYDNTIALIAPYVQKDPTAFCTFEEFQKGSAALREFNLLRSESIKGQLQGTIAATSEEQTVTGNAGFINASAIDVASMGSNSMGFGRARGGQIQNTDGENVTPVPNGSERPAASADQNTSGANGQGSKGNNVPNQAMPDADNPNVQNPGRDFPNMNNNLNAASAPAIAADAIILMAASVIVLIGGILFVKKR